MNVVFNVKTYPNDPRIALNLHSAIALVDLDGWPLIRPPSKLRTYAPPQINFYAAELYQLRHFLAHIIVPPNRGLKRQIHRRQIIVGNVMDRIFHSRWSARFYFTLQFLPKVEDTDFNGSTAEVLTVNGISQQSQDARNILPLSLRRLFA